MKNRKTEELLKIERSLGITTSADVFFYTPYFSTEVGALIEGVSLNVDHKP